MHPSDSPLTTTRRGLLKKAAVAGGVVWMAPAIESFVTSAAAASAALTVDLVKSRTGNNVDPSNLVICTTGGTSTVDRGDVTLSRTESTLTIAATITISSGPDITGREVFILQSDGTTCIGGDTTSVGTWAASPASGPQSFSATILTGATHFVLLLRVSGGGGTDSYASEGLVNLP